MARESDDIWPNTLLHAGVLSIPALGAILLGCSQRSSQPRNATVQETQAEQTANGQAQVDWIDLVERGHQAQYVVFSPAGDYIAVRYSMERDCNAGKVVLWECATRRKKRTFDATRASIGDNSVAFSPDGRHLVTVVNRAEGDRRSGEAVLWELNTGTRVRAFPVDGKEMASLSFSPDGTLLATGQGFAEGGSVQGDLVLWDVKTGQQVRTFRGPRGLVEFVAFSRDGRLLATAHLWYRFDAGHFAHHSVAVREATTGKMLRVVKGQMDDALCIAFAPDGRSFSTGHGRLATSDSRRIHAVLWDVETGRREKEFMRAATADPIAFSPDGKLLATGSSIKEVILWDVDTGEEVATFGRPSRVLCTMAFSPDGRLLATGWADGTVRIWRLAAGGFTMGDRPDSRGFPGRLPQ